MTRLLPTVFVAVLACLPVSASADLPAILTGQLWSNLTIGDDPAPDYARHEELVGYIPTFSLGRELPGGALIDLEWAYRAGWATTGNDSTITSGSHHRLWARYSGESLELRLGLQKIAFGPALVLRPLAWFDTIDPEDPTNQTDGVSALRVKYYAPGNTVLWGWAVQQKGVDLGLGGRLELSLPSTELGLTYHGVTHIDSTVRPAASQSGVTSDMSRVALDLRYDGYIGLWLETVVTFKDSLNGVGKGGDRYTTIGADYTLPVGNGVLVLVEHMTFPNVTPDPLVEKSTAAFTAALASLPLGMLDTITAIAYYDWNSERLHSYLRYSRTYDALSANLMVKTSPRRKSYGDAFQEYLPSQLAGFGTTVSFMLIYNH